MKGAPRELVDIQVPHLPSPRSVHPKSKKPDKGGRRYASRSWMNLNEKRKSMEYLWNMEKETGKVGGKRKFVRACRNATKKAKVHLKLNLMKEAKNNKKGFSKHVNSKRRTRENVGPLN